MPYRDSKLTHYLKDSLGGESKTMLIVQVSPCSEDASESVSSLQFGARVQMIEKGEIKANVTSCAQQEGGSPLNLRKKSRSKSRLAIKNNNENSFQTGLIDQSTDHSKYVLTPVSSSGLKLINLST